MTKRALIFINGQLPDRNAARTIVRSDDVIIAVNGGTRHALDLGLLPSVVLGDLDSIDPVHHRIVDSAHTRIIQYPHDKDKTDLALALEYALERGYHHILLLAAVGGRLDQTIGNLALLTDSIFDSMDVRLDDGLEEAFFTRKKAEIDGRVGETVSLIPWGADVTGVCTEGLRWPLEHETLNGCETRGISNEMLVESAHVQIETGLLLIIHQRKSGY